MARLSQRQKHLVTIMILYLHLMETLNAMLVFMVIAMLLKNRSRHRRDISYASESSSRDKKIFKSDGHFGTSTASSSRKRKRSEEGFSEMVEQIGKWRDTCEVASRGIEKIATYFEKAENRSKRMFAALEELGLLNPTQLIDVFEAMCKDQYKFDVFSGLPEPLRRQYVLRILKECNVYRPPFHP